MPLRPIIRYPDPRLRLRAVPVTLFDAALAELAADLLDTMRTAPGIGIAGPHIGALIRVIVIQLASTDPVLTCVNPSILTASAETERHTEGSISMPGISEEIERPKHVTVGYQDLAGIAREVEADGLLAVCLQHEIDQLDGIFWLQKLSRLKRERAVKRFGKAAASAE